MQDHLLKLLAMLTALEQSHHACHLTAKGPNFFEIHQLFGDAYDGIRAKLFDPLAEMAIALGVGVEACRVCELAYEWLEKWEAVGDLLERGLRAELDLQKALSDTYDALKRQNTLPLALDDELMGIAGSRSRFVYLFQRITGR